MTDLISAINLSKKFQMGSETINALNNLTIKIKSSEFIAIKGASGSGKSTLLYILGLLDQASSGQYFLEGRDVSNISKAEKAQIRNQNMGFVFQSFHLLPRSSAIRNVSMPLIYASSYGQKISSKQINKMAVEALETVGLTDRLDHKPNELSGGQRQRVAIARAIVNKPKLLFADEPTGNLDSENSKSIMHLFRTLNQSGVSIIMVTHDPEVAKFAGRVITMKDGQIENDILNNN